VLELTKRLLAAAEGGTPVLSATLIDAGPLGAPAGARMLVEPGGERLGSLGEPALDAMVTAYAPEAFAAHGSQTVYVTDAGLSQRTVSGAAAVYLEVVERRSVFVVVGAGHVGRSVAKLADFLDYHVVVLDDREDFADAEKIPEADEVICEDFEEALERFPIDGNTWIVMVTRGHKQDELSLRKCLGRGAAYLGMIGSRRRTATVLEHLRDEGFDPEELAKVRTPIGLDIGAETPEEIAVSILSEVILLRKGGTSAPMYYRKGGSRRR
jgi:xanthine dehydrogenase accessory factor